ncbi:MAG: hypothetical protein R3B48_12065 [Kofleriaceae bacterium]
MTPAVGGAAALAMLAVLIARDVLDQAALRHSNDEVGNYIQALGAIYAVLAAFVVYAVWTQLNEARLQCDREANELIDLSRVFEGFPEQCRRRLQVKLATYVDTVIHVEWPAMAKHIEAASMENGGLLDDIWSELHSAPVETECQRSLHAEALTRFNDLSDARTARLSAARARIPLSLSLLLYFGGLSLVGSMLLVAIESLWIHALTTASLASAVAHLLYVVADLDDAFAGDWQVSREPFERAQRFIAKRAREPAAAPSIAA